MFISIEHEIHNPREFQKRAVTVFPLPDDLQLHLFLPADDLSRATCLYEADSIARLSEYLDGKLGDASSQHYFRIAETEAIGLPHRETV